MTDDGPQREMTLEEWVGKLPKFHRAHREYDALIKVEERARELSERGPQATTDWRDIELNTAFNELRHVRS